jgi:hypothetical protein
MEQLWTACSLAKLGRAIRLLRVWMYISVRLQERGSLVSMVKSTRHCEVLHYATAKTKKVEHFQ